MNTACLYSTVKNTSGGRRKFGFLGAHGKELAANEEYTEFGDIRQNLQLQRVTKQASRRAIASFEQALLDGDLEIIATPSPILYDEANDESKALMVDTGALYMADPCWHSSSSSVAV